MEGKSRKEEKKYGRGKEGSQRWKEGRKEGRKSKRE